MQICDCKNLQSFILSLALMPVLSVGLAAGRMEVYLYSQIFDPFFSKESIEGDRTLYKTARPLAQPGQFVEPKPEGTVRIFVVGGSIANAFMHPRGVRLDKVLERAFKSKKFEAIDCGMAAYDSYRVSLVLGEVLDYHPDIIVVLSGNNEAHGEGAVSPLLRGPIRQLNRIEAFRKLRDKIARLHEPSLGPSPDILGSYESNLGAMVQSAKKKGIPIVLCTLPVNFRDIPPQADLPVWDDTFLSGFDLFVKAEYLSAARRFREYLDANPEDPFGHYYLARSLDAMEKFGEARKSYLRALDLDRLVRCSPSINNVIRKVSKQEGVILADLEKAFLQAAPNGLLGSKIFLDGVHWREEYNGLASRVVFDALLDFSRKGWRDWHVLGEPESWNGDWIRDAEDLCFGEGSEVTKRRWRKIQEKWLLYGIKAVMDLHHRNQFWGGGEPGRFSEEALAFFEVLSRHNRKLLLGIRGRKKWIQKELKENIWTSELAQDFEEAWPNVLAHVGETCRRLGLNGEALDFFDDALACLGTEHTEVADQRPAARRVTKDVHKRGLSMTAEGNYSGAAEFFTKAIHLNPNQSKLFNDRGLARFFSGQLDGALKDFKQAIELEPGNTDALMNLAFLWRKKGEYNKAVGCYNGVIDSLEKAQRSDLVDQASYADSLAGRGAALLELGQKKEAVRDFRKSLEVAPNSWRGRGFVEEQIKAI